MKRGLLHAGKRKAASFARVRSPPPGRGLRKRPRRGRGQGLPFSIRLECGRSCFPPACQGNSGRGRWFPRRGANCVSWRRVPVAIRSLRAPVNVPERSTQVSVDFKSAVFIDFGISLRKTIKQESRDENDSIAHCPGLLIGSPALGYAQRGSTPSGATQQGSTPSGATQQRSTPNGATQQGSTPSGAQQGGAAQFGSGVIIGPGNGEHRVEERDRIRSDRSRDDLTTQTYVVPSEKTGDKTSVGGVRC